MGVTLAICAVSGSAPGNLARVAYEVRTPVFEGPFDLLLHLIVRDQVDVYQVSLSRIVDAYVEEIERLIVRPLEDILGTINGIETLSASASAGRGSVASSNLTR